MFAAYYAKSQRYKRTIIGFCRVLQMRGDTILTETALKLF